MSTVPAAEASRQEVIRELTAIRPKLVSFARLQLRDPQAAEDAVQEALLVAIEQAHRFQGRSSVRTWVTTILKNRIIDHFRRSRREVPVADGVDADDDAQFDALFDESGRFREDPSDWSSNPEACFAQRQFFEVLQVCIDHLPAQTARVFMMREWLELSTDEICQELSISTSNCWVILYRARMRLRECLDANWFGRAAAT